MWYWYQYKTTGTGTVQWIKTTSGTKGETTGYFREIINCVVDANNLNWLAELPM